MASAFGDEAAGLDPEGRQLLLEGGALAGPAGAALAGAQPMSGVMGKQALERLASEGGEPLDTSRPSTAGGGQPFKTEGERRRAQLDQKRRELVESRMRPQSQGTEPAGATEPRPPPGPRPQPSQGFVHPISPRRLEGLEVEGQLPPGSSFPET